MNLALFPGLDPVDPLSTRQLNRAIHAAAEAARIDAHAAPLSAIPDYVG
jgi:integrase/recombinase XerD